MRYSIRRSDGGVSITSDVPDDELDKALAGWKSVHVGEYVSHHPIDGSDIPTQRVFRNAWTHDGSSLIVDMAKARDMHRDMLRAVRQPKLDALDAEFIRAIETGDENAKIAIIASKQELRDVTDDPRIEAAKTADELMAVIPEALKLSRK